jgi:hypothetical protein
MTSGVYVAPTVDLDIFIARQAPVAVILRRGPSKWVRMSKWYLKNDTFEHGQWFKGRVREETCDISPDGVHFIYGAYRENRRRIQDDEVGWCWSAISRPPYFTALALWSGSIGDGSGGLFQTNSRIALTYWIPPDNGGPFSPTKGVLPRDVEVVTRQLKSFARSNQGLWEHRGWRLEQGGIVAKDNPAVRWMVLKKKLRLKGDNPIPGQSGSFQYYIEMNTGPVGLTDITWADWDFRGRLVFARGGKLFTADMAKAGFEMAVELADFNDMAPEAIVAPNWAKKW